MRVAASDQIGVGVVFWVAGVGCCWSFVGGGWWLVVGLRRW